VPFFLKFLQYEEFFAYLTMEPGSLTRLLDGLAAFAVMYNVSQIGIRPLHNYFIDRIG
jgi:hypothetical protein